MNTLQHPAFVHSLPKNFDEMVLAMLNCEQTKGQSVYQHGMSVGKYLFELIDHLKSDSTLPEGKWRLPDWLTTYKTEILANLHDESKMQLYTLYHDCGKPFCRIVDSNTGQNHFPDNALASSYVWSCVGGDYDVGRLIADDMIIHTATAEQISEKLSSTWNVQDSMTLLLTALAEIHSNGRIFGGIESTSFKMKWKTVDRRGKQILKHWFGGV